MHLPQEDFSGRGGGDLLPTSSGEAHSKWPPKENECFESGQEMVVLNRSSARRMSTVGSTVSSSNVLPPKLGEGGRHTDREAWPVWRRGLSGVFDRGHLELQHDLVTDQNTAAL